MQPVPLFSHRHFLSGAVCHASRAHMRVARQILAEFGYGGSTDELDRLAAGPLRDTTGFLAGCGVCFVLIGWERGRWYSCGCPSAGHVRELVGRLPRTRGPQNVACPVVVEAAASVLPGRPVDDRAAAEFSALRGFWIESALGVVVEGLRSREMSFVLGWQIPGESRARLDHSVGADLGKVEEWLRWFVEQRLVEADEAADRDGGVRAVATARETS